MQRLLASEIRKERSTLLQCVHFVVANARALMDGDASVPLVYPEMMACETAGDDGAGARGASGSGAVASNLPPPLDMEDFSSDGE